MFSGKDLRRLLIPLVIEQVLAVTVGMADIVMVAEAGEAAVSGVSLVDTINILLINILSALATGGAVVSAQYLGNKEKDKACAAANQLLLSVTFFSLLIALVCLSANPLILKVLYGNTAPAVMKNAEIYFYLSALSYPFLAVYNSCAALYRSMGNSRVSMMTSFVMNAINISGNALLVYVFNMGVAGVGISSLASRAIAAVIMLLLIRKPENIIHIEPRFRFGYNPGMIRRILRIGIPNGMENGMFQIGKILVQKIINSAGTTAIAANAVANTVASFAILPGTAMGLGLITVVGQCVGAGDFKQAKKYTGKLMKIAYLSMGTVNLIIFLLVKPITGVFHLSAATSSTAVLLLVYHCICSSLIWPVSFTLPNALRAANDVKYTMTISIISMWVWRIAFCYLLSVKFQMGVFGVWVAMTIDWLFRSVCFLIRFFKGKWARL